jgi:hypothetical protein
MNAAMKFGVNKLLAEEELRQANESLSRPPVSSPAPGMVPSFPPPSHCALGNGIFDMLSFALACATGAPLGDDEPSRENGFRWEPSSSFDSAAAGPPRPSAMTKPKGTE